MIPYNLESETNPLEWDLFQSIDAACVENELIEPDLNNSTFLCDDKNNGMLDQVDFMASSNRKLSSGTEESKVTESNRSNIKLVCDEYCAKYHSDSYDCSRAFPPAQLCSHHPKVPHRNFSSSFYLSPGVIPYKPVSDHCYSAPVQEVDDQRSWDRVAVNEEHDVGEVNELDVFTNLYNSYSSETHSEDEEVDVITIGKLPPVPVVSSLKTKSKGGRSRKNAEKPQRTKTVKSLEAAIKRTKVTNIRRVYSPRTARRSVETSSSSSVSSSAQSSRCNSDAEDFDKRENHNCAERNRREAQKTALQNLRVCIPSLQDNPKAPKVLILNSATSLVQKLKHDENALEKSKYKEMQRRKELMIKINFMRQKLHLPPI